LRRYSIMADARVTSVARPLRESFRYQPDNPCPARNLFVCEVAMSAATAPVEFLAVQALRLMPSAAQTKLKEWKELRYWRRKQAQETNLTNLHYAYFYTQCFGLGLQDYRGHRILDVGCGPRGSLEWATTATEAVGVDPLAD